MSGGSYDYIYSKDLSELLSMQNAIESMRDRLAGLCYAEDAAKETQELLLSLRQWDVQFKVYMERLSPVWKAIEWWDSMDSDEKDFKKALAAYRKGSQVRD